MGLGQIALLGLISARCDAKYEGDAYFVEQVYHELTMGGKYTIPASPIELLLLIDRVIEDEFRKLGV